MKTWYSIKALAQGGDTAEVSIMSEIGKGGVRAVDFLNQIAPITAPKIRLTINSPGGSVVDAVAIVNGLRALGKTIEVHILGIAASAASYVAMVGQKIVMPGNTFMFVHNPVLHETAGNAADLRQAADTLDQFGDMLVNEYQKRFKGTETLLRELLAAESWLSAAECLKYGLCDEVTGSVDVAADFDTDRLPATVRATFMAPPKLVPLATTIAALAKEAGLETLAAVFVNDPGVTSPATAAAAISVARDITAIAKLAGLPGQAEALIRGRKTLPEARIALNAAMVEADESIHIDTARKTATQQPADPQAGYSTTSLWAEIRAMRPPVSRK